MDAFSQGVEFRTQGRYAEALPCFQQAIAEQPTSFIALTNLAEAQIETDRYAEALTSAEQALKLNGQYALAWLMKARALNNLHRIEEAIAACNQALTYDPTLAFAYTYKGRILANQERDQEALVEYDQALMIDSTSIMALSCKAGSLIMLERLAEARVIGDRLINLYPTSADGWRVKAAALYSNKAEDKAQNKQALILIERALEIKPDDSGSLTIKGAILEMLGRHGEARAALRRAAEIDSTNVMAHEGLEEMQKLQTQRTLHVTGGIIRMIFIVISEFFKAVFSGL